MISKAVIDEVRAVEERQREEHFSNQRARNRRRYKRLDALIVMCPHCDEMVVMDRGEEPEECPICDGYIHGGHMVDEAFDLRKGKLDGQD